MKKEAMVPGRRYRGYGFINEYREFTFEPEDKGAHAGRTKSICTQTFADGCIAMSETKNLIIVRLNLEKKERSSEYVLALGKAYNELLKLIKKYEL